MGDVDIAVIAQRLVNLRKTPGRTQGSKLTIQDIAEKRAF
jgi:hypothetical protein